MEWKLGLMKMSAAAMILAGTAGGFSSVSAEETGAADEVQAAAQGAVDAAQAEGKPRIVRFHTNGAGLLSHPAHQRSYWKLLVQTYSPETADAWAAALEERKAIEASLPKPEPGANRVIKVKGKLPEGASEWSGKLPEPTPGIESPKVLRIHPDGDTPVEPAPADGAAKNVKIFKFHAETANGTISTKPSPEAERLIKLGEAVEADDAEAVRVLLPQLLEDYRKQTEELKKLAEKLKALETDTQAEAE
ncbi:hypothetical protein ACVNS2_21345 [Paenibacillus caseinilyticus]|uniref:Bypass of forespore C C-terminal domain-containing protein n=1 Tax=Paenibacillus mucilaginosus K02 TaxID=997761 RepID=I0BLG2_9BACL|nr:hypothetical protein [Paenibacillus mucilaginosus]AFH63209.1 hypothetical protein B2K_21310 [Paenibacillus mucilaginosus K02]AFK65247.1 hypothetical protein [Paenibacillus mucilaginosus K02]